ncbi:MAG: hypothetical protein WD773_05035 [Gemmatimonadales bacterium]
MTELPSPPALESIGDASLSVSAGHANRRLTFVYDLFVHAIILTGPLVVYGVSVGGISLRFSRLLVVLSIPILLLRLFTKPSLLLRDRFLVYGLAPYLAYTSLSIFWSLKVETGGWVSRLGGLYEISILYVLLIVADLNTNRFRRFVHMYLVSAIIPMLVSGWQLANNLYQFSPSELPFDQFVIAGHYEELEGGRYFVVAQGFSRISATFAEPVIFSTFVCSVLLLSLLLHPKSGGGRAALRVFQLAALIIIVLGISKLSLISLTIGLVVIVKRQKRAAPLLAAYMLVLGGIFVLLSYYGLVSVFERLLSGSGHYELLIETLRTMRHSDLILGQGIGSVPFGSFHRFVLSRVYESGVVGLIFVGFVTAFPFQMLLQTTTSAKSREINGICVGVLFAVVFGLHAYDFFIHLWPWTVMGAMMSFYNSESALVRAARLSSQVSAPVPVPT